MFVDDLSQIFFYLVFPHQMKNQVNKRKNNHQNSSEDKHVIFVRNIISIIRGFLSQEEIVFSVELNNSFNDVDVY